MLNIPYLITNNTICITYEYKPFYIHKLKDSGEENDKYDVVKQLIKDKNFEKVIEIITPKQKIIKKANQYFVITEDDLIYMKDAEDESLPSSITKRLIDFVEEDLPLEPLVNFWINLRENPSSESKTCLYRFLEHNKHSITQDGYFIAYKAVNFDKYDTNTQRALKRYESVSEMPKSILEELKLTDAYSHSFNNSIGSIVKMDRSEVDPDPNNTCSNGLHVASYDYAKNSYSADIVVQVKVHPKDVVSVPFDYNNQKMRCCKYEVVAFIDVSEHQKLAKGDVDTLYDADDSIDNLEKIIQAVQAIQKEKIEAIEGQDFEHACFLRGKELQLIEVLEKEKEKEKDPPDIDESDTDVCEIDSDGNDDDDNDFDDYDEVDLIDKTSKEIVDLVKNLTGDIINFNLKSKRSIVRKAKKLLEAEGYDVIIENKYK